MKINGPRGLERLPEGSVVIEQDGQRATKVRGCWQYSDGQFWEPMYFPLDVERVGP